MKRIGNLRVGTKLTIKVVSILVAALVACFAFIIVVTANTNAISASNAIKALAEKDAAIIKAELEVPLVTARAIAQSMQGFEDLDVQTRRSTYNTILKNVLAENPGFLGVWTCWEPEALDRLDAQYANSSESDSTGRFIPYWQRVGDDIVLTPLVDYEIPGAGDYYMLARDLAQETILEPFLYEVGGKMVLMTSVVVPIADDSGNVVGVAGIDLALDEIQGIVFDKGGFESAYVSILSNTGLYVYSKDGALIGANVKETSAASADLDSQLDATMTGKYFKYESLSAATGKKLTQVYAPIIFGNTATPWSAEVVVETDEIMAATQQITWMLVAILAGMVLIISIAMALIIRSSISKPITETANFAKALAAGTLDQTLKVRSSDEIGQLAGTLNREVRQAFIDIEEARIISDKQRSYQKENVDKLVSSIDRLSHGDLNCIMSVAEPDHDTQDLYQLFSGIKTSFAACISAVNQLVADANMLSNAAVEGLLSTRADASRHQGDFRKIVEGVNKTLDAVIEPVNEASEVLVEMSKGNLGINVMGNYKGDHATIKNALNDTINTVKGYIGEIAQVLTAIADGNLKVGISNDYRGDFEQIKDSINNIVEALNSVLGDINTAADQVASGTNEVASGSQALSQGATEQASSIEELTSSLTEIAAQTRQNAVNAGQANDLAMAARDDAAKGNNQMNDLQKAMTEINESSTNISKIIKVIDEIAFQTNLLALNAAVEAARAGQHGKGFAVVAEEVRSLAQRSASAAKETTEMIEGSIKKVKAGTEIANDTAEALVKIMNGVDKATTLVGGIARASNEQAMSVSQVNTGIEQVSQVTQTNSATAEQSAAASEQLSSQAVMLKEMVGKFSLKNQGMAMTKKSIQPKISFKALPESGHHSKPKISLGDKEFGKY